MQGNAVDRDPAAIDIPQHAFAWEVVQAEAGCARPGIGAGPRGLCETTGLTASASLIARRERRRKQM